MIVIIRLWDQGGVDCKAMKIKEESEEPMDLLRWAIGEFAEKYGHAPSDCRLKVR